MLKNDKGFTLVELILAIAILALVGGTLLKMFVVSSKANNTASEIDHANLLATSKAEEIKKDPKAFLSSMKNKVDKKEKEKLITNGTLEEYYDGGWNKTDKAKAKFVVTTKLTCNSEIGDLVMYKPKINSEFYGDPILRGDIQNYLLVVVDPYDRAQEEGKDYTHNYLAGILYDYKLEDFCKQVEDFRKKYPGIETLDETRNRILRSLLYQLGHARSKTVADMRDVRSIKSLKGSVPIMITFPKSDNFTKYNLKIVNYTKSDVDIYLSKESLQNEVNYFNDNDGNVSVTNLSSERKIQSMYEMSVTVNSKNDKSNLAKYVAQKYVQE